MNVPALVWLGNIYLAEGRLDDAERALRRGLTVDARNVGVLGGLDEPHWRSTITMRLSNISKERLRSTAMPPASIIRSRSRIAAWETFRMPARTFALAVTARKPWPIR